VRAPRNQRFPGSARLALAVLEEQEQVAAAGVAHLLLAYIENERGDADYLT
jgi:hypothetical protein